MLENCPCCNVRGVPYCTTCVISLCRRCINCLAHCQCPETHARGCGDADGLTDPEGPFSDLAEMKCHCRRK